MIRKILLTVFIVFMVVWVGTLLKYEYLTYRYGKQFETTYKQCNMIDEIDYLKVMEYTPDYAEVYYVTKNKGSGNVFGFSFNKREWIMNYWSTIWSNMGSASDVIFPYWWHFIYGGL